MAKHIRQGIAMLFILIISVSAAAADVPEYSGEPYVVINNNIPYFSLPYISGGDMVCEAFERYSELDSLGRCGTAFANICTELMPTTPRESLISVTPTGWHSVKYDFISGKYLYNRCHLIGRQLAGEDANPLNLITGTRYLNVTGMLPFENMVADYVKETGRHVLYRVTPYFDGNNLVADGVLMEAQSIEDNGDGICFNVFCYNVEPGVVIDYATGESGAYGKYIIEKDKWLLHTPDCAEIDRSDEMNIIFGEGALWEFLKLDVMVCPVCSPQ